MTIYVKENYAHTAVLWVVYLLGKNWQQIQSDHAGVILFNAAMTTHSERSLEWWKKISMEIHGTLSNILMDRSSSIFY